MRVGERKERLMDLMAKPVTNRVGSDRLQKEKIEGTVWELQENFDTNSTGPVTKSWQAFSEDPKPAQTTVNDQSVKSVRTRNGHQTKPIPETTWGFETDSFAALPTSTTQTLRPMAVGGGNSRTIKWISSLNMTLTDPWRPWIVDDQAAGVLAMLGLSTAFEVVSSAQVQVLEGRRGEAGKKVTGREHEQGLVALAQMLRR